MIILWWIKWNSEMLNNCKHKGWSILFLNSLLLFQNPDAWALMGHVKYMTNDVEASRDCYERTISFTSDAAEMHSIYLRLASIYLQEEKVSNNLQLITDGDNQICEIFCTVFLLTLYIFWLLLRIQVIQYVSSFVSFPMQRTPSLWPARDRHLVYLGLELV